MTRDDAQKILKEERIQRINWFNSHELREDEVGIKFEDNQWVVYATSERAGIVDSSIAKFSNESDALINFIKRARTEKLLF